MTEKDAMLWLCSIKNMWYKKMERLLEYFENPVHIFEADGDELENCGCLKPEDIVEIQKSRKSFDVDKEKEKLQKLGIVFLTQQDEQYPKRLRNIADSPIVLFAKGRLELLKEAEHTAVSVIGARVCSHYGIYTAEKFARELALNDVVIVSGMARGVDSAAHTGALEAGGNTIAVLGCGVDICYPNDNKILYDRLCREGLVISEYPPGTPPMAWQFPKRNRIISGLSDCVLITEAREKSGSLITAQWALEQGIDVCAVPGRINDPLSQGCNRLIREGATPVTDVSDIMLSLGINYKNLEKQKIFLEKENEVVYSVLGLHPQSMDEIMKKTNLNTGELYRILLKLELAGLAEEPVKNYYIRKK